MAKFKVTPYNIKNGNKAPYFVIDAANKDEGEKAAAQCFRTSSSLSRFSNWDFEVDKLAADPKVKRNTNR